MSDPILDSVRADPRFPGGARVEWRGGRLLLRGEVDGLREKSNALRTARQYSAGAAVVDRLTRRAEPLGDEDIAERLFASLAADPLFEYYTVSAHTGDGEVHTRIHFPKPQGWFRLLVTGGGVLVYGFSTPRLQSLMAAARCWLEPSVRAVRTDVVVEEAATDVVMEKCVRRLLEADRRIDARSIEVFAKDDLVMLSGPRVAPETARIAEELAWCTGANAVVSALVERRRFPRPVARLSGARWL